jgi:hypothetical protein
MTIDALRPCASAVEVPWYRQRWPWLLIAGPGIVVAASLVTAWLAASTDDGVIADDYYKRGLLINKEIDRTARGKAMHLGAVLRISADGAARLEMSGFADAAIAPATIHVRVMHPTRAGQDRAATLTRGPEDVYVGTIAVPPPGRWVVAVESEAWRLPTVLVTSDFGDVRIGAARTTD